MSKFFPCIFKRPKHWFSEQNGNFEFLNSIDYHGLTTFMRALFQISRLKNLFLLTLVLFLFSDCRPEEEQSDFVTVRLKINHSANGKTLVRDQFMFQNAFGQLYSIQSLDYFISNVKLRDAAQNQDYTEVASYHLVNALQNPAETVIAIRNVPRKKFSELVFSIGVDSIANSKTDQVGDLDPGVGGMAWDWTTGYKFFAMTGRWQKGTVQKPLVFHIGENFNYKTLTFRLPYNGGNMFDFQKDTEISLSFDLNEAFQNPDSVNFENTFDVESGPTGSARIASNYADGLFKVVGVR